jgi:putative ABC transport system permease protein
VDAVLRRSLGADGARVARTSVSALIARESERVNWFGRRFGLLGLVMLVMAAVGTASLMRGWVMSLRPELGLRRAVGATEGQLLRLMLGRATLVGAGGILRHLVGPALGDALRGMAAGLESWDPELVAGLAILLFASTVGGVALPAWRATRAVPAELLASADE